MYVWQAPISQISQIETLGFLMISQGMPALPTIVLNSSSSLFVHWSSSPSQKYNVTISKCGSLFHYSFDSVRRFRLGFALHLKYSRDAILSARVKCRSDGSKLAVLEIQIYPNSSTHGNSSHSSASNFVRKMGRLRGRTVDYMGVHLPLPHPYTGHKPPVSDLWALFVLGKALDRSKNSEYVPPGK